MACWRDWEQSKTGNCVFRACKPGCSMRCSPPCPRCRCDDAFRQAAEELRSFEGIEPVDPPAHLYRHTAANISAKGWAGCNFSNASASAAVSPTTWDWARPCKSSPCWRAGLGPTKRQEKRPTLIVVPALAGVQLDAGSRALRPAFEGPRSHRAEPRQIDRAASQDWDIVLTTYGTLRRDVLLFKDAKFDYCILDEAQIVKNAGTDQAKAVRLLQANHRLCPERHARREPPRRIVEPCSSS